MPGEHSLDPWVLEAMGIPRQPETTLEERVELELARLKARDDMDAVKERILVLRSEPKTDNGGTPPSGDRVPIILLAGAIKWWWGATCVDCGHYDDAEIMRTQRCLARPDRASHNNYVWWNSPEFRLYTMWREEVRSALIAKGYLTYAPWMAFKGTWDERAQAINNSVIDVADAVVVLSPNYAITEGTDEERKYAISRRKYIFELPPDKEPWKRQQALIGLLETLGSLR
jgi:hypothetical protein